jgi:hypothetical protein
MNKSLTTLILSTTLTAAALAQTPRAVEVERHRILYLSREYLRHSHYIQGKQGDFIVAWGWRILQFPLNSGKFKEVVPEDPKFRFSNGSAVVDLNNDGNQELIAGRYLRENHTEHEILWYERPASGDRWVPHHIGATPGPKLEMPHDLLWYSNPAAKLEGVVLTIGRAQLYLFEKPGDPKQPWKRHDLGRLPDPPQSGMRIVDMNRDGRPDIVTGMFWLECPPDPRAAGWTPHRYGEWDRQKKPWGGMNKHAIGDFDGDGELEMVVNESENEDSRVAVFKRNSKNPGGLWEATLLDTGLYCPHTLEAADLNEDGRLDFLMAEMDAGGWQFPVTATPRVWAYLNRGGLKFERLLLSGNWGVHEGKIAPKRYDGRLLFYGNSTTQPWYDGMVTNLSTWTIQPVRRWKTAFEDPLSRPPAKGWSWIREKAGAWKAGADGLALQTLPGTLWAKTNTAENVLVRPMPAARGVTTEVTVTATMAEISEQAGLIWYAGDDNYIKLVKEQKETAYAILAREEEGAARTYGRIPVVGPEVRLRLSQSNGRVWADAWMPEFGVWQFVGECAPLAASGLRAGFFTHGAPAGSSRWARFQGFRLAVEE